MSKKIIFSYFNPTLSILIIFGVFLRLIKLKQLFHFTYDEEIIAFVGKRMFVNGHIPLIGGVTPMHVHVAPYFYWISGIFLSFSKLNPLGWGVIAAIVSGITMFMLYLVGKTIFNQKAALIAVFFYSFSFYQNVFDRHYWGLMWDGLISLIVLYSLFQLLKNREKYIYLLAISLSFGFHTDSSILVLFLLTGSIWLIYKPIIRRKIVIFAIIIFLISFIPLLVFDIKHNFSNSKGIFQFIAEIKQGKKGIIPRDPIAVLTYLPQTLLRNFYVFGDTDLAKQYSYCPQYALGKLTQVPFLFVLLFFFSIGFFYYYQNQSPSTKINGKIILILFISVYLGISIYGIFFKGDLFDHYLATLFPIYYLVLAVVLVNILKKGRIWLILLLIIFASVNLNLMLNAKHSFGFSEKEKSVKWAIDTVGNEHFSLDVIGNCFRYNGYRYLFYLFGKEPVKSYVDANFTHLYDQLPAEKHPKLLVVFTNPDFKETAEYFEEYQKYQNKLIKKAQFGRIEVLIIDNSQLDFVGKF